MKSTIKKTPAELKMEKEYQTLTDDQKRFFDLVMHSDAPCYLMGKGGCGKTHVLKFVIWCLREVKRLQVACIASTGVAAQMLDGCTVHRFFRFGADVACTKDGKFLRHAPASLVQSDVIIWDEAGMSRCDVFQSAWESIKAANLKRKKLGKSPIRLIVCADFAQLPPCLDEKTKEILDQLFGFDVRGAYAFMAPAWKEIGFQVVELNEVVRQSDREFIDHLTALRNGDDSAVMWFFEHMSYEEIPDVPYVYPFNKQVEKRNLEAVKKLPGKLYVFKPEFIADTEESEVESLGLDKVLYLKIGAKVMFTDNACRASWISRLTLPTDDVANPKYDWSRLFRNGTTGIVRDISWDEEREDHLITVEITDSNSPMRGKFVAVYRKPHEIYDYRVDARGRLSRYTCGTVMSHPLRLAYAITCHRSQGQSYTAANICTDGSFAHGMAYVALSRCQSIERCHLMDAVKPWDVICDPDVTAFYQNLKTT